MNKHVSLKKPPEAADYEVGYKRPPASSRFKSGASGNPSGGPKRLKPRSMAREIQNVFTREITVRDGNRKRRIPSIVALIQTAMIDAMKGDQQAARFCYRIAEEFGVFKLRDEVQFDFSGLSEEEQEICRKGADILNRAGMLSRYDRR